MCSFFAMSFLRSKTDNFWLRQAVAPVHSCKCPESDNSGVIGIADQKYNFVSKQPIQQETSMKYSKPGAISD